MTVDSSSSSRQQGGVGFRDARYGDDVTAPLIAEIQADLTVRYGGPDETPVDPAQFTPDAGGLFLVAVVDGEVIDLRWLDRASVDWDTIGASIQKTNRVVIVEQGSEGTSYGGWLSDEIQRRFFDWLDAPITRVQGSESSPSISKVLEKAALAHTHDIVAALRAVTA